MPNDFFPIQLSKQVTVSSQVYDSVLDTTERKDRTCLAKAFQRVRVPAGEFDTVKVVCTFGHLNLDEEPEVFWYSPDVGNYVRSRLWRRSGNYSVPMGLELVGFERVDR